MTDAQTTARVKLLPCPFCGGADLSVETYAVQPDDYHGGYVACTDCDAHGAGAIFRNGWLSSAEDARVAAIAAWNNRHHFAGSLPDGAEAAETIANAADDWQAQGYASALDEVRDMANVGRALMQALPEGYSYNNCPSEIVADLLNERDEAAALPLAAAPQAGVADGWVMVPREPTFEMVDAGEDSIIYHPDDVIRNQAMPCWSAMLSAAPKPPERFASQEVERLREALEPFAKACTISTYADADVIDDTLAANKITWGHLRRALSALADLPQPDAKEGGDA